ncbi:membrane hypothetical protein [Hyella patelloides LEGE 07179]|uniref:CHASE2 domain-containing protein n=1 Tax=Hyella patelloides LEGE 07179 TaxID=945734 RepID=A0A563VWW2_9CYAN|nr:CHASE2 domain-containing protein [Hyella patelloides]VEP15743.1 membrane hypothetical protein [Hyella patelloides LEGE 07179]
MARRKGLFRSPAKMPGVFIQANITSQIISSAIDNRPLLRTYNKFIESLWILLWGIIGVIIAWHLRSIVKILIYIFIISIILIIFCYRVFIVGWWLPLVPSLLTLIATVITAVLITNKQRDRFLFQHTLKLLIVKSQTEPLISRIALEYFKRSENKDNSSFIEKEIKKLSI